jgi:hypothetical protein
MSRKSVWHVPCGSTCKSLLDPKNPPDPDDYGNLMVTFQCRACGERGTVVHLWEGGRLVPRGFAYDDEIEWVIPLGEN